MGSYNNKLIIWLLHTQPFGHGPKLPLRSQPATLSLEETLCQPKWTTLLVSLSLTAQLVAIPKLPVPPQKRRPSKLLGSLPLPAAPPPHSTGSLPNGLVLEQNSCGSGVGPLRRLLWLRNRRTTKLPSHQLAPLLRLVALQFHLQPP